MNTRLQPGPHPIAVKCPVNCPVNYPAMLANLGPPTLLLMLSVFVFSLVFGLICLLLFLSQRQYADAIKTLLYLLLLAATTSIVVFPALRMHGSFSHMERLQLLGLHLATLLLMVVFIRSRLRLLSAIHKRRIGHAADQTAGQTAGQTSDKPSGKTEADY